MRECLRAKGIAGVDRQSYREKPASPLLSARREARQVPPDRLVFGAQALGFFIVLQGLLAFAHPFEAKAHIV